MVNVQAMFRPLFIVRVAELVLGLVCFILVTKYFSEFEAATGDADDNTASALRLLLTKSHLVTVAAFAYPFIACSTLVAHMMDGQVVEKEIQPLLLALGGAICNVAGGIFVLVHASDNTFSTFDVYDSSSYYCTAIVLIITGIVYLADSIMANRYRRQ